MASKNKWYWHNFLILVQVDLLSDLQETRLQIHKIIWTQYGESLLILRIFSQWSKLEYPLWVGTLKSCNHSNIFVLYSNIILENVSLEVGYTVNMTFNLCINEKVYWYNTNYSIFMALSLFMTKTKYMVSGIFFKLNALMLEFEWAYHEDSKCDHFTGTNRHMNIKGLNLDHQAALLCDSRCASCCRVEIKSFQWLL